MTMNKFSNKISLICYISTIVLSIAVYFTAHYIRLAGNGTWGYLFGYGTAGTVIMFAMSFIAAAILGFYNVRKKWIYPFFAAVFIWLIPPTLFYFININHNEIDFIYFGYALIFGAFYLLPHLIISFMGLGLGLLIRKNINK